MSTAMPTASTASTTPKCIAPSKDNNYGLPSRYEIRQLTSEHADWANAIVSHSNTFHSPVWSSAHPSPPYNQTARAYAMKEACTYLIDHQIASGLSHGIFDKEYTFKHASSRATNGQLHWDPKIDQDNAKTPAELLAEMDFPLCSVAMAYDSFDPFDMTKLTPVVTLLPGFGIIHSELDRRDVRVPETWQATGTGQVMFRASTCTRYDYGGRGLMKALARFLMNWARDRDWRAVQIECAHDAVRAIWERPPEGMRADVVGEFPVGDYVVDVVDDEPGEEKAGHEAGRNEAGREVKDGPFGDSTQVVSKIFVTL